MHVTPPTGSTSATTNGSRLTTTDESRLDQTSKLLPDGYGIENPQLADLIIRKGVEPRKAIAMLKVELPPGPIGHA